MPSRPPLPPAASHDHAPTQPSGLRQSHTAASYESLDDSHPHRDDSPPLSPCSPRAHDDDERIPGLSIAGPSRPAQPSREPPTERTSLLASVGAEYRDHSADGACNHGVLCNHGTFSPRPMSPTDGAADQHAMSGSESDGSLPAIDASLSPEEARKKRKSWKKQLASRMKSKKMSTSSALAERHGVRDSAFMFVPFASFWRAMTSLANVGCPGTSPTTSPSWCGRANTAGPTSRATLSPP